MLTIQKLGDDYKIRDEFRLDRDSGRRSSLSEAIAEVDSNNTLRYKQNNAVEFKLDEPSS